MPLNKELKKIKREAGRIVKQTGNFIERATELEKVEQLGKSIAKLGKEVVDKQNQKLQQPIMVQSSFSQQETQPEQIVEPQLAPEVETESVVFLSDDEGESVRSVSSSRSILIQQNLQLMKRVEELEKQMKEVRKACETSTQSETPPTPSPSAPPVTLRLNLRA